ncbi:hypothetical protein ATO11_14215 [Pseudaestuariivita atlantica]|uniref:Phage tail protein n=1 Tax=Pseudaestuariivita atlantica TaxID=1317121 RepID=A0A0L1JN22_9RHOB|nr:hypothetical protein ATO11_14215 [Pseudaestuariivita atlantica]
MTNPHPPVAFSFAVRIAGTSGRVDGGFSEVSGLGVEREVAEVAEGGENRFVHKLPGRVKHENLVLKRGMVTRSSSLFKWCDTILSAPLSRRIDTRNIQVSLLNERGRPLMVWTASRAWPVKWDVATFDAKASEVAIETMEFAYENLARDAASGV